VLKGIFFLLTLGAGAAVLILQKNNKGQDSRLTKKDFSDKK
jgi:hypothetical protein